MINEYCSGCMIAKNKSSIEEYNIQSKEQQDPIKINIKKSDYTYAAHGKKFNLYSRKRFLY